ncbi:hypothetical protein DYR50_26020, partial [Escherichia coli]|nr:hypothetical protein [Escherichia coli]
SLCTLQNWNDSNTPVKIITSAWRIKLTFYKIQITKYYIYNITHLTFYYYLLYMVHDTIKI